MEENNSQKEAKKYVSLSTRISKIDAVRYIMFCKRLGTNTSERLREIALQDMSKPKKHMRAGVSKIKYDKMSNSFRWNVRLDTGEEIDILDNISDDFLKNLRKEIDDAMQERNDWVHQTKTDSVEIPEELLGEEE